MGGSRVAFPAPPVAQMATPRTNLPWGLNKGHPTTVIAKVPKPSNRKGRQSARSAFVKSIVREVAGFAPYERRVMELIRNSKDKKARKLTKKRLGTLPPRLTLPPCCVSGLDARACASWVCTTTTTTTSSMGGACNFEPLG